MATHSVWLETSLGFPNYKLLSGNSRVDRQKVSFDSASGRTKWMKTQDLRAKSFIDELCYAAHMGLGASGETDTIFFQIYVYNHIFDCSLLL